MSDDKAMDKATEGKVPEHGPVNMDDGPEVAKGPETAAARVAVPEALKILANKEVLAGLADAAPRDHAEGKPQTGVVPPPLKDAESDCGPDAVNVLSAFDRAAGQAQTGIAADPDPVVPASGLKASLIAEIAYNAVQEYKSLMGQDPVWFRTLLDHTKTQIVESVVEWLRGAVTGAAGFHEIWQKNMLESGVTIEDDPRLGEPWLEMDPAESRKGLIFVSVLTALTRPI